MPDLDLSQRIVYSVEGMSAVKPRRHVYKRDADTELVLDVYLPTNAASNARIPALFFVHGGPIPQTMLPPVEWGVYQSYAQLAAVSGLAGVVLNHRLFAPTAYLTAEADLIAAVDFARTSGALPEIDADRIGVWAFSGGGPLLSWCLRERPPFVRCLLAFYAFLDLRHLAPPAADAELVARLLRLSPAAHLTAGSPPVLVARAGLDNPLINTSIDVFVKAARAANVPVEMLDHPRGQHGFDVIDANAKSRDIIAKAIAFANEHLRTSAQFT